MSRRRSSRPARRTCSASCATMTRWHACSPDATALRALQDEHGSGVLYVAWWDGQARAVARGVFAQDGSWSEDPATGSAAGPLTALLHDCFGVERLDVE